MGARERMLVLSGARQAVPGFSRSEDIPRQQRRGRGRLEGSCVISSQNYAWILHRGRSEEGWSSWPFLGRKRCRTVRERQRETIGEGMVFLREYRDNSMVGLREEGETRNEATCRQRLKELQGKRTNTSAVSRCRKLMEHSKPLLLVGSPIDSDGEDEEQTRTVLHMAFICELYEIQVREGRYFLHTHSHFAKSRDRHGCGFHEQVFRCVPCNH